MSETFIMRNQINTDPWQDANKIMASFLLGGLKAREDDSAEFMTAIRGIIVSTKGERGAAMKKYRSSHDLEAFLTALIPIYNRILYDAYAPYWLLHCRCVNDADAEVDFTYYNDLIDMYWAAAWQEWKRKDKWEVMLLLPPTKGLISLQRRRDERR